MLPQIRWFLHCLPWVPRPLASTTTPSRDPLLRSPRLATATIPKQNPTPSTHPASSTSQSRREKQIIGRSSHHITTTSNVVGSTLPTPTTPFPLRVQHPRRSPIPFTLPIPPSICKSACTSFVIVNKPILTTTTTTTNHHQPPIRQATRRNMLHLNPGQQPTNTTAPRSRSVPPGRSAGRQTGRQASRPVLLPVDQTGSISLAYLIQPAHQPAPGCGSPPRCLPIGAGP